MTIYLSTTKYLTCLKKKNFYSLNLFYEQIKTSRPQMVQVVSIDDVPIRFGSISFQSNDVSGAQKSEFLF